MKIDIKPCLSGAHDSRGVVIVIDVFRSGNTAAAVLNAGAPFVALASELEEARQLKAQNPGWLLVGERKGLKPDGFDMNNSPAEASTLDLKDRPSILTTAAGTYGLVAAAPKADALLMATLVNLSAAAKLVRRLSPEIVTLVPIGLEAKEPAVEDDIVGQCLADALIGRAIDHRKAARAMLAGPGAARLRSLGQWRDLAYCLRLDRLNVVPKAETRDGRLVLTAAWPDDLTRVK